MAVERTMQAWRPTASVLDERTAGRPATAQQRRRRRLPILGVVGLGLTGLIVFVAIAGPWLVGIDPAKQDLVARLSPPIGLGGTLDHPMGTDSLGRDLLARLLAGARLSLLIGVAATLVAGTIGIAAGLIAGFGGGIADRVVMWFADVQMAIPFVIVAIALTTVLGVGLVNVLAALVVTGWVAYARVVRLQARALRSALWVDAARSLGADPVRVAVRHILPNVVGTIAILASQQVAGMILYEAALSYLGLGIGGDAISWGGMVADGQGVMAKAWWVSVVPGAAVALTVFGLNSLGDWLSAVNRGRQ